MSSDSASRDMCMIVYTKNDFIPILNEGSISKFFFKSNPYFYIGIPFQTLNFLHENEVSYPVTFNGISKFFIHAITTEITG